MPQQASEQPEATKFIPEKVVFSWKAPTYAIRKKDRSFWVKLTAVVSLLGFIFFVAEGIMPVVLLVSVLFLFYVLSSVEPENAQYFITNKGINIANKKNSWEVFKCFRFVKKGNLDMLSLDIFALPGKIEIIINEKDKTKIENALTKYIPKDDAPQGRFDKASDWVSNKIS